MTKGTNLMTLWRPKEIIVHESVREDSVTTRFLNQCPDVPVRYVESCRPQVVIAASDILLNADGSMLDKIHAGKQVVFIAPAMNVVDVFTMPDTRLVCPHFDRLKLASNGCHYACDFCFLKLTYRNAYPYITLRAHMDRTIEQISKRLSGSNIPVMFNTGELADSLSMEHLTGHAGELIFWFGSTANGYMFELTKSDNVDSILDLPHNKRTIIAWSMNNAEVSRKFEIGAPPFDRRLVAARKVQDAGYPLRIRLDPIIPIPGWQDAYADTINKIFTEIQPERITIGTLRFEEAFYRMRNTLLGPDSELLKFNLEPMFPPKLFEGSKKPKSGKYSFSFEKRIEIFSFVIGQIRRYSDCKIALCKESREVWNALNLDLSRTQCVCQLDYSDMSNG